MAHGVTPEEFNSYGTRRGDHVVAVRATFANNRLKNEMVPGIEGSFTRLEPGGDVMPLFDAAQHYLAHNQELVVIAGANYGCGSSRDWAAKGVRLLGIRAVICEGFERIHRTNLVGMGAGHDAQDAGNRRLRNLRHRRPGRNPCARHHADVADLSPRRQHGTHPVVMLHRNR
jgi:hypothetical protein